MTPTFPPASGHMPMDEAGQAFMNELDGRFHQDRHFSEHHSEHHSQQSEDCHFTTTKERPL